MFEPTPSTIDGYTCFSEVLNEVRDVYVDDLIRYTARVPVEKISYLKPEPRGVYVRGMLEPMIDFDSPIKRYYTESQYRANRNQPNVLDFDTFVQSREPIVDERGVVICTIPAMIPSYFHRQCDFNHSAVHFVIAEIWQLLEGLSPHTNVCTTIPRQQLDPRFWLRNDTPLDFKIGDSNLLGLIDSVYNFVQRDYLSLYSLRLRNTTLYVEKGNDFRVIEYYRSIFEKIENERFEQHGF